MTEERRRVLDMLSEEKITVEEAERLLQALTRKGRGIDAPLSPIPNGGIDAPLSPIPNVGATLSGWSESDKGGKTSKRDDTFAVGANPRLVVRGFNGRIRVHVGEPGSIRVRSRLKNPHCIEYSAVQEGDIVTIEAKPDQQSEGFLPGLGLSRQLGANIEVTVPVTTSVDLATSNGPVELRGTEGEGTVQTKNGRIRVEKFKGDLNATTKNAPISVKTLSGVAQLSTSNSRVSIEDGRGRFDVRTTNGTIKFQGSMEPKSHNRLSTLNGNIKAALDAEPSLKLTAATTNGRVRCEVPGFVAAVEKRHKLEGTLGTGEAELIAETKNGSIVVQ